MPSKDKLPQFFPGHVIWLVADIAADDEEGPSNPVLFKQRSSEAIVGKMAIVKCNSGSGGWCSILSCKFCYECQVFVQDRTGHCVAVGLHSRHNLVISKNHLRSRSSINLLAKRRSHHGASQPITGSRGRHFLPFVAFGFELAISRNSAFIPNCSSRGNACSKLDRCPSPKVMSVDCSPELGRETDEASRERCSWNGACETL